MLEPGTPSNESERLEALQALGLLDTLPEERFDRFTRLARRLFDAPIVLVSLVDANRQWFKSRQGLDTTETPRNVSFCGHAILEDETLVIPDATVDPRFSDNPLVTGEPHVCFYAGAPLRTHGGERVGTLCVIDRRPREFGPDDLSLLRDVADMVEHDLRSMALASTDELTGLSNRRGVADVARHVMARARRENAPVAMLYIDLDKFKPINDRFGHATGDAALRAFATLMLQVFRQCDIMGRIGGDEFCVLLSDVDAAGAEQAMARLRNAVAEFNASSGEPYQLEYSIGMSIADSSNDYDLDRLLARADASMYEAKKRWLERFAAA